MSGSRRGAGQPTLSSKGQHKERKQATKMAPAKLRAQKAAANPPVRQAPNNSVSEDPMAANEQLNLSPSFDSSEVEQLGRNPAAAPTGGALPSPNGEGAIRNSVSTASDSADGMPPVQILYAKNQVSEQMTADGSAPKPTAHLGHSKGDDAVIPDTNKDVNTADSRADRSSVSTYGPTEIDHFWSISLHDASTQDGDTIPPSSLNPSFALEVEKPKPAEQQFNQGVYWVFGLVFLLEVFVNFDSGVVPAILTTLEKEFDLVGSTEGLLGALPYIGLGLSSPFVGRGLTLFSPKYFCLFTMLLNVLATGLLGVAIHRWMLFFSRLLLGLTQAGFSIYAPVWVDRFAPPEKLTLWMGLTQGGVVMGTMLGCVTAGALDAARRSGIGGAHWRYALAIQFVCLLTLVVAWGLTPRKLLEIHLSSATADETESVASSQSLDETESVRSGEDVSSEEEAAAPTKMKISPPSSSPMQVQLDVPATPVGRAKSTVPQVTLKALGQETQGSSGSEEERGEGRKEGAAGLDDTVVPYRERRALRTGHRHSDLPEYLKDPLSNLLPLDFFASNAQPRRVSQIRHQTTALAGARSAEGRNSASGADGTLSSQHSPTGREAGQAAPELSARQEALLMARTRSAYDTRESHRLPLQSPNHWNEGYRQDSRGEGINSFQYQMTFLTPHPTTLAFEALNWASGTQDPMLLVQREARQPSPQAPKTTGGPPGSPVGDKDSKGPISSVEEPKTDATPATARRHKERVETDLEKNAHGLPKVSTRPATAKEEGVTKTFGVRDSIRILLSSPLYVCVTFSLCALFFEVTAIQFWSITYFEQVLKRSTGTVLIAFNVTAATAPISGVLVGGWFIDFIGGYKDEHGMRTTMSILLFWATACFILGIGAGWTASFWVIVFCMWWILFFGGCILPAATGIVIASVPVEVRAFGSGFCMMVFNVFGYVLGTFLPGIFIEAVSLSWGMRVIYLWSINGVLGFALACCLLWRLEIKPTFLSDDDELQWSRQQPNQEMKNRSEQQAMANKKKLTSK